MNYPFSGTVLEFFNGGMNGVTFGHRLGALLMRYPQQTNEVVFNLLGSHDTPRLLTCVGDDKRRLKLAVLFLFTFMGTPCIYYGDEIGLTGSDDPDCRKCMEWDKAKQDRELYDFYKMMIALRKENKALREGRFRILQAYDNEACLVYERPDESLHFTIWMNNTPEHRTLSHPMETNDWQDALTNVPVDPLDGIMNIELEPYGYRILCRSLK